MTARARRIAIAAAAASAVMLPGLSETVRAAIIASPPIPIVGEQASFTTTLFDCNVLACTWTFDDGTTGTGPTGLNTWTSFGSGTGTVTVVGDDGDPMTTDPTDDATVTLNAARPDTGAVTGAAVVQAGATAAYSSSSNEGGSTFTWSVDGSVVETGGDDTFTPPAGLLTAGVTHIVSAQAVDGQGAADLSPASASVFVNQAPPTPALSGPSVVQIDGAAASGQATFEAAATDPDGHPVTYQWQIDGTPDSATGASISPSLSPGPHTISVQADDGAFGGVSGAASASVYVNRPPSASFSVTPSPPTAGQPVKLTASASDPDPGDTITQYEWDLDGSGFKAGAAVAEHEFSSDGDKTVRLRVTDDHGGSVIVSLTVAVSKIEVGEPFSSGGNSPAQQPSAPSTTGKSPRLLSPFPRVRYAGRLTSRGVRLTLFYVRVPKGALVVATCSRRCPAKSFRQRTGKKTRDIRLRNMIGNYRAGAVLRIRVTQSGRIGKYTTIVIAKGKAPRRTDMCLWPTSSKPRKCPS